MEECADFVVEEMGKGNLAAIWAMGSTGQNKFGSLDNVTLYLGCDITAAVADDPPDACTEAAHTVPPPNFVIDPVFNSAVTYVGAYGDGSAAVLDVDYDTYAPGCGTPPCRFDLEAFDLEIDDVTVGDYLFESITLSLDEVAEGTRTGSDVTIPAGNLVFNLSTVVSVDGEYLYGTAPYEFTVVNTEDVEATYFSGFFNVQFAEFDYGDVIAVLNTSPPVF